MRRVAVAVVALVGVLAVGCTAPPPTSTWQPFTAVQYPNVLSGMTADFLGSAFALASDDGKVLDPSSAMGVTPSSEQVTWLDDHHLLFADSSDVWILDTQTGVKRKTSILSDGSGFNLFPRASGNGRVVATRWYQREQIDPFTSRVTAGGVFVCVFAADFSSEVCTSTPLAAAYYESEFLGSVITGYFIRVVGLNATGTAVDVRTFDGGVKRYPVDGSSAVVTDTPTVPTSITVVEDLDGSFVLWGTGFTAGQLNIQSTGGGPVVPVFSWANTTERPSYPLIGSRDSATVPAVFFNTQPCFDPSPDCASVLRRWDPTSATASVVASVPWSVKDYTRYGS